MSNLFDLSSYGLTEDLRKAIESLINSGAEVTVEALEGAGVAQELAKTIYTDYTNFLSSVGSESAESEQGVTDGAQGEGGAAQGGSENGATKDTAEEKEGTAGRTESDSGITDTVSKDSEESTAAEEQEDLDYKLLYENYKKLYEGLLLLNMINEALQGVEFTSPFAREGIVREILNKNLEVQDGKLVGIEDYIAELKLQYPEEFKSSVKNPKLTVHRDTTPDGSTSRIRQFLSDRYKNNPWFRT